jgi:hypothetical protein
MRRLQIAQCQTCKVAAVQDNGPDFEVPAPIYGPIGLMAHRGHVIQYFGARVEDHHPECASVAAYNRGERSACNCSRPDPSRYADTRTKGPVE